MIADHYITQPRSPVKVIVVDDHALVRSGIVRALSDADGVNVVAEAGDGMAALRVLEECETDVVLMDVRMPRLDGLACLDEVVTRWPRIAVLMLSVDEDPATAADAIRRGARGFINKAVDPADLAAIVREISAGTLLLGAVACEDFARSPDVHSSSLTARENEILQKVADGMTNAEIARELFVSIKTVKFHLTSIFAKLGVTNRTQAAGSLLGSQGKR